jgi:hypothetical protein
MYLNNIDEKVWNTFLLKLRIFNVYTFLKVDKANLLKNY